MRIIKALLSTSALVVFLFSPAIAAPPGPPGAHLDVTQVMVDDPDNPTSVMIIGTDLDFGNGPLSVTLGEFGALVVTGTPSDTLIEATLPAGIYPGDFLLTVANGNGQSQNDEYDLTIGAVGPQGDQGKLGPQGEQGKLGPQGVQGDQGKLGPQGDQGKLGPQGEQGKLGAVGDQGEQGKLGFPGPQGEQGKIGAQGEQGKIGPEGPPGPVAAIDTNCPPGQAVIGMDENGNFICDDVGGLLPAECSNNAVKVSTAPGGLAMVCDDPTNSTCEQDVESLCPANWHLCSDLEHNNRNSSWNFNIRPPTVVGEIFCRTGSGAGHFTLGTVGGETSLGQDTVKNCHFGSARPDSCNTGFGCNEKQVQALCCAPSPLCGNGVVDAPEEECDDGNSDETDACLNSCSYRLPATNGFPGFSC